MAQISPSIKAFSGGEFSALMEGRTDLDAYPSSLRSAINCILTPQGPVIGRSGTQMVAAAYTDDESSTIVPFIFSNQQAEILEFCEDRIRFVDESGIQVYAPQAFTLTSTPGDPMVFTCATLASLVGDQVVINGLDPSYNLNGVVANITNVVGTSYTLDINYPALPAVDGTASKVYAIALPYTEAQRQTLTFVQDTDLIYLFVAGYKVKKLTRFGNYDWRLADVTFIDGPYMPINTTLTTLLPSSNGNAVPSMTTNTAPSGMATGSGKRGTITAGGTFLGRVIPLGMGATDYFNAFDSDLDESAQTYWAGVAAQAGYIEYDPAVAMTVDGYSIHLADDNQDVQYSTKDYAPRNWVFQGWNGAAWVNLDKQLDYGLWTNNKSVFFKIKKPGSYTKYRLYIKHVNAAGPLEPRIGRLVMRSTASASITLTASAVTGINSDQGFLSTDVGRLIRILGDDGFWRSFNIAAVASTVSVTATLLGEPFRSAAASETTQWRMGLYSDTTGYPSCGELYNERLYLGGCSQFPNALVGSVVGAYETMMETEEDGIVLDDSAIVRFVKGRRALKVQWIKSDDNGLIVGTTEGEFSVDKPSTLPNYTPGAFDVRLSTEHGCASVQPVRVDNKILYVQRNKRTLRQFQYTSDNGSYTSDNLSKFASHLGVSQFVEMDFAAEPHSMNFVRRGDNSIVALTYNPVKGVYGSYLQPEGESVLAWGRFDFAGALVESIAVIPQEDQRQDMLWLATQRLINGTQRRYIEFMKRPWDFGDTILEDAHFVDCALRYQGAETDTIYGLQHLELETVYGLADGVPIAPKQVIGGTVILDNPASNVILGLGYETFVEISRIDQGALDGAALGKSQRINAVSLAVWDTAYGEIGKYDAEYDEYDFEPIDYRIDNAAITPIALHTAIVGPFPMAAGWDNNSTLAFRRPLDQPLPFNVVALFPRMAVTDGP